MESPYINFKNNIEKINKLLETVFLGTNRINNIVKELNIFVENERSINAIDLSYDSLVFKLNIIAYGIFLEDIVRKYFDFYKCKSNINKIVIKDYKGTFDCKEYRLSKRVFKLSNWDSFLVDRLKIFDKDKNKRLFIDHLKKYRDFRVLLLAYGVRNIIVHNNGIMNKDTFKNYPICAIDRKPIIDFGFLYCLFSCFNNFNRFLNDSFKEI